ncbi:MAG: ADP-ribosylglycohydrolase family protein [Lachnospiraceae bacterium]
MYGAILGDIIGSPYEFDRGDKTKTFPLFSRDSYFTDDSVMTIAVAEALLQAKKLEKEAAEKAEAGEEAVREVTDDEVRFLLVNSMKKWGRRYPGAGYGGRFYNWLFTSRTAPYGSFGNGSAMRASAAGWLYDTLEETLHMAALTADVTHNHPEGIKGAQAAAGIIFLARTGASKEEIRRFAEEEIGYDLSRTCDQIRPTYHHVESCQKTVPEAITAFLEGQDFEDVIRTAVSLGGDCDTLTCIAGSMAEAYYGVPDELKRECEKRIPVDMREILMELNAQRR